jgi:hypothetical protein
MRFLSFSLICCVLIGALACAGNGQAIAPGLSPDRDTSIGSARTLWGLYDVAIDPDTLAITVLPARTAQYMLDVNTFMNMNPASLTLNIIDASQLMTEGLLTVNVNLTHPLPTKPKLAGLDVHCAFMTDSTATLTYDDTLAYAVEGYNPVLLNPDGWTRWYNAQEFTGSGAFGFVPGNLGTMTNPMATLNPYKLYADGLAPTADAAGWLAANKASRALFTAGTTNTREFQLKFPVFGGKPFIKFQYAVITSWKTPTSEDPGPEDFPPEANCAEASALRIDTAESTMYWTPTEEGGDLVLNVDIFDWQGGDNIQGQVSKIVVESSVLSAPYVATSPSMIQTAGSAFATWSATIPATVLENNDPVDVWVIVESSDPITYNHGGPGPWPADKPLAAFNSAPAVILDVAPPEPPVIISGVDIKEGTTLCPDRSFDNAAVLEVVAEGDNPLTYSWTIMAPGELDPLSGYDGVPGNGDGTLDVDFTAAVFADIISMVSVMCEVDDGMYPPVQALPLELHLDCIFYHADLEDPSWKDNGAWHAVDIMGLTNWMPLNGSDASGHLAGTGALWQSASGNVESGSKGMLISSPIIVPDIVSSAQIFIQHSYYFSPFNDGGNIKIGNLGTLQFVTGAAIPISSGQDYDGDLTDNTNAMYPQTVFSDNSVSQPLYLSIINLPGTFIGGPFQLGFAAASGGAAGAYAGGWMIDDVKVIGTL